MSATFTAECPECGKRLQVPARLEGKKIRCKGCEKAFSVTPADETPTDSHKPVEEKKAPPAGRSMLARARQSIASDTAPRSGQKSLDQLIRRDAQFDGLVKSSYWVTAILYGQGVIFLLMALFGIAVSVLRDTPLLVMIPAVVGCLALLSVGMMLVSMHRWFRAFSCLLVRAVAAVEGG